MGGWQVSTPGLGNRGGIVGTEFKNNNKVNQPKVILIVNITMFWYF
jgi:hypothetical protein